jgi:hypothetical protein
MVRLTVIAITSPLRSQQKTRRIIPAGPLLGMS